MSAHRLGRSSLSYTTKTVTTVAFTQEELDVLEALLWHVGGDPSGARGVVDRISDRVRPLVSKMKSGRFFDVKGSLFLEWLK